MRKRLFLIGKNVTKVLLYNQDKTFVECQKMGGKWCVRRDEVKDELSFEPIEEKEFFRLIAESGWFCHGKKFFKTVFNVSEASEYVNLGYTVLDTATFTSFKQVDNVLVNAMNLPRLPEGTYIVYPFQPYILPTKKEKPIPQSEKEIKVEAIQKDIRKSRLERKKRQAPGILYKDKPSVKSEDAPSDVRQDRSFDKMQKEPGFWERIVYWGSIVGAVFLLLICGACYTKETK